MKKIVRGNDFTLRVPVRRIVNGEKQRFPLPACEEIEVNLVNAFRRRKMEYTIGVEDDSLLEVSVHSSEMALGSYALEVKGKLFGSSWRSNEYEQIMFVDNNASGDTEFGETDEGEDSVEMDTALVVLAPVIVIDGDIEVIKDEIANGVRDGAWLPVKAGRDANGNVVTGAVVEGLKTTASGPYSHAEGNRTIASKIACHAEGLETKAYGTTSHAEGFYSQAGGSFSHAEGMYTKAGGDGAHAEGRETIASGDLSHAQGCCNYDDKSFINMVGVGSFRNKIRKNASVIYVGRDTWSFVDDTDPKNGYQYLLDVGGYKGQAVENGMKSVQEVFADHDSRIAAVETGGSVKKSKPKIEYVVGRAIKCSLLTCSSNDRVRYVALETNKTISLLVGNAKRSLLAKNGDSIKVKFMDTRGNVLKESFGATHKYLMGSNLFDISSDSNNVITCTNKNTNDNQTLYRVSCDIKLDFHLAWYVSNVTLRDDGVYVITLDNDVVPSSFDTVSPNRKYENGIVVNKRLPYHISLNDGILSDSIGSNYLQISKYTQSKTKWLENKGGREKIKKIRYRRYTSGICHIRVIHKSEKKSCYIQTWVLKKACNRVKRLQ